jgi:ABC-type multidrug transport system ATPase subunit
MDEDCKYPIKIVKLSKTYTKFFSLHHTSKNALDNLTLCSEKNQVLVILGHNGSGKTTAINGLVGLQQPTAGDVLIV